MQTFYLSLAHIHKQSVINNPENMGERIQHFECTGSVDHHPIKTVCAHTHTTKPTTGSLENSKQQFRTDQKPMRDSSSSPSNIRKDQTKQALHSIHKIDYRNPTQPSSNNNTSIQKSSIFFNYSRHKNIQP